MPSNIKSFLNQPANQVVPQGIIDLVQRINQRGYQTPVGQVVQSQKNLGTSRIAAPVIEATGQIQQGGLGNYLKAAMNLLSAGVNATPAGNALNMAQTGGAAGLQSIRGQGSFGGNMQNIARSNNSGVASQGLGMTGLPAIIGDIALSSPTASAKMLLNPQKMSLLARNSIRNPNAYEWINSARKTIDKEDLDQVIDIADVIRTSKKGTDEYKQAENVLEVIATRYVPPEQLSKLDSPVKVANWIFKNLKDAKEVGRTQAGKFASGLDKNLLRPRK